MVKPLILMALGNIGVRKVPKKIVDKQKKTFSLIALRFIIGLYLHHSGNEGQWLHDVVLSNKATGKVFNERLAFTYIELTGFNKPENQLQNDLEKWVYALKNLKHLNQIPAAFAEPDLIQFCQAARYINLTKEEKEMISAKTKARWDNYAVMEGAKILGHRQGLEEGEARGIYKKAIEMAIRLKAEGFIVDKIAEYTGLDIKEVEAL